MLRLAAAREGLDDHHASAAAGARTRQHTRLIRLAGGVGLGHRHAQRHGEQLACARDVGGAIPGEQAVMADAMEALRKDVAEEAANELVGIEGHRLVAAGPFDPIVLALERDACVIAGDQPAIGDGDAVGIARQVSRHLLGTSERLFSPPALMFW